MLISIRHMIEIFCTIVGHIPSLILQLDQSISKRSRFDYLEKRFQEELRQYELGHGECVQLSELELYSRVSVIDEDPRVRQIVISATVHFYIILKIGPRSTMLKAAFHKSRC